MEIKDKELSHARNRTETLQQENASLQASLQKMQEDIEGLKKTSEYLLQIIYL